MALFDIGGTPGERDAATGKRIPFPSTVPLLATVRDVIGARIGIITPLGPLSNSQGRAPLRTACSGR